MDTTTATAAKVEAARILKGVSRLALSDRSGIARTTLKRKLDGRTAFTVSDIDALAQVLEVAPESLLEFRAAA